MEVIGTYDRIRFNSLEELKEFVFCNKGDAYYYDGWQGEVYGLRPDATESEVLIGFDGFDTVTEETLKDCYGYIKK